MIKYHWKTELKRAIINNGFDMGKFTLKDIYDGQGTLTIVGSLQNKSGRGQPIPEKFKGAMNYRCN